MFEAIAIYSSLSTYLVAAFVLYECFFTNIDVVQGIFLLLLIQLYCVPTLAQFHEGQILRDSTVCTTGAAVKPIKSTLKALLFNIVPSKIHCKEAVLREFLK